jgi:peptide/nickel transport system substrate-binding protein
MRIMRPAAVAIAALALAAGAAACSSHSTSGGKITNSGAVKAKPVKGGTITVQWPGAYPNFIFPLLPATNTDGYNGNLDNPMWPTLVYSGDRGQSIVNPDESLFSSLTWADNDSTINITLKPWKWSDGQPITSRDFLFTYNLLKSMGTNWIDYLPGLFPEDVKSVQTPTAQTIVINLNHSYNPAFYDDNVLSEIPLLPQHAWDEESASGPVGNFDETAKGAAAVVNFLQKQGSDISTFTSNPLWKVVDGPWTLSEFTSSGNYAFVPNKNYSGPDKPYISEVINETYTTDTAAWNALLAGDAQLGGIPSNDYSQIPKLEKEGYSIQILPIAGVSGATPNFYAPNGVGVIFQQLYIRQAMEYLINRPEIVQQVYGGYADPMNGPVSMNFTTLTTPLEKSGGPYPYDPAKAVSLLKTNGWSVVPNGTTTCQDPGSGTGQCGAGIPKGAALSFQILYPSGSTQNDQMFAAMKTWAAAAGIQYSLKSEPFNTIAGTVGTCTAQSHPKATCSWQITAGGYDPYQLYPTGAGLFNTGGAFNSGGYSNPEMDQLINETEYSSNPSYFAQYENYAAEQLPNLWMPLTEIVNAYKSTIGGIQPGNPFSGTIDPELWYYTK